MKVCELIERLKRQDLLKEVYFVISQPDGFDVLKTDLCYSKDNEQVWIEQRR